MKILARITAENIGAGASQQGRIRAEKEVIALKGLLDSKAIQTNIHVNDWEDAVRLCGKLLVETGKVTESYVQAMVQNIHELGPYIIIAPEVALPHSRPEDGVRKKGISVLVLDESITFAGEKRVKLLIGLAATDKDSHMNLLQQVAEVIGDEERLKRLKNAGSAAEVEAVFEHSF